MAPPRKDRSELSRSAKYYRDHPEAREKKKKTDTEVNRRPEQRNGPSLASVTVNMTRSTGNRLVPGKITITLPGGTRHLPPTVEGRTVQPVIKGQGDDRKIKIR